MQGENSQKSSVDFKTKNSCKQTISALWEEDLKH